MPRSAWPPRSRGSTGQDDADAIIARVRVGEHSRELHSNLTRFGTDALGETSAPTRDDRAARLSQSLIDVSQRLASPGGVCYP
jgi:hypothetical protein